MEPFFCLILWAESEVLSVVINRWQVRVDTGGTFTDGWACDPAGQEYRCKVLSSGCLRGVIKAVLAADTYEVEGFASFEEDFFVFLLLALFSDRSDILSSRSLFSPMGPRWLRGRA